MKCARLHIEKWVSAVIYLYIIRQINEFRNRILSITDRLYRTVSLYYTGWAEGTKLKNTCVYLAVLCNVRTRETLENNGKREGKYWTGTNVSNPRKVFSLSSASSLSNASQQRWQILSYFSRRVSFFVAAGSVFLKTFLAWKVTWKWKRFRW